MSQADLTKLRKHSELFGAIGIYVYTDLKKKYLFDTSIDKTIQLIPVTKKALDEWKDKNKKIKELEEVKSCNCYYGDVKHDYL